MYGGWGHNQVREPVCVPVQADGDVFQTIFEAWNVTITLLYTLSLFYFVYLRVGVGVGVFGVGVGVIGTHIMGGPVPVGTGTVGAFTTKFGIRVTNVTVPSVETVTNLPALGRAVGSPGNDIFTASTTPIDMV